MQTQNIPGNSSCCFLHSFCIKCFFYLQQNFSTTCCIPFVLAPKDVLIKIFWFLLWFQWLMLEWIVKQDAPSSGWTVAFTDLTAWFNSIFQINAFCLCDLHVWHKISICKIDLSDCIDFFLITGSFRQHQQQWIRTILYCMWWDIVVFALEEREALLTFSIFDSMLYG